MNRQETHFFMKTTFNPDDIGNERNPGPAKTTRGSDRRHTPAELEEIHLLFADHIQREEEMWNFKQGNIESE